MFTMSRITFPLWFFADPDNAAPALSPIDGFAGKKVLPVFTDGELARSFRAALPTYSGYSFSCIGKNNDLASFLDKLERSGFTHVLVDPGRRDAEPLTLGQLWRARPK
jgi:hypothetical protein